MQTWNSIISTTTTGSTRTLEVNLPKGWISVKVILSHGSGAWSVEKTLFPFDDPGNEYRSTRFAIAYISGWGFSYRWERSDLIKFRPYNTSGDVNGDFSYKLIIKRGV